MILLIGCGQTNGSVQEVALVVADEASEDCMTLDLLVEEEGYNPTDDEIVSCGDYLINMKQARENESSN